MADQFNLDGLDILDVYIYSIYNIHNLIFNIPVQFIGILAASIYHCFFLQDLLTALLDELGFDLVEAKEAKVANAPRLTRFNESIGRIRNGRPPTAFSARFLNLACNPRQQRHYPSILYSCWMLVVC